MIWEWFGNKTDDHQLIYRDFVEDRMVLALAVNDQEESTVRDHRAIAGHILNSEAG